MTKLNTKTYNKLRRQTKKYNTRENKKEKWSVQNEFSYDE